MSSYPGTGRRREAKLGLGAKNGRLRWSGTSISQVSGATPLADFPGYATVHLSYLLRLPDEPSRQAAYRQFRDDLNRARALEALAAAVA
jgi:hypothetical protein